MSTTVKRLFGAGSAVPLALRVYWYGGGLPAHADPVWHQVVYIVSSAKTRLRRHLLSGSRSDALSDYSHNPYSFTPQVHADVAPDKPWVQPVNLLNPDQWAMVTCRLPVGQCRQPVAFSATLSVDGNVVVSKNGPKGALCSLRTW